MHIDANNRAPQAGLPTAHEPATEAGATDVDANFLGYEGTVEFEVGQRIVWNGEEGTVTFNPFNDKLFFRPDDRPGAGARQGDGGEGTDIEANFLGYEGAVDYQVGQDLTFNGVEGTVTFNPFNDKYFFRPDDRPGADAGNGDDADAGTDPEANFLGHAREGRYQIGQRLVLDGVEGTVTMNPFNDKLFFRPDDRPGAGDDGDTATAQTDPDANFLGYAADLDYVVGQRITHDGVEGMVTLNPFNDKMFFRPDDRPGAGNDDGTGGTAATDPDTNFLGYAADVDYRVGQRITHNGVEGTVTFNPFNDKYFFRPDDRPGADNGEDVDIGGAVLAGQ